MILAFVLPNVFNTREEKAFSSEYRLQEAKKMFNINHLSDSVTVLLSGFYTRGSTAHYLFGKHYRALWNTQIKLPVFNIDTAKGGLTFLELGGGQQTLSAELKSKDSKTYTLRSVDKDQSKALPVFLQYSFLRPLFRDQASALNPFGALITSHLEESLNILHTQPKMYFVPYDSSMSGADILAGRAMILEEEPDSTWIGSKIFDNPIDIISTEEMIKKRMHKELVPDSLEYLKCRLLDFLISDWDRHEGQWEWAVFNENNKVLARPIAMDRDMAFFKFDDGTLNQFALVLNNKFQSFNPEIEDVSGLIRNSKNIDYAILKNTPLDDFLKQSNHVQNTVTDSVIDRAFKTYPSHIYAKYGENHASILKQRITHLDSAATDFYKLLHD